jgi:hypothetical protein
MNQSDKWEEDFLKGFEQFLYSHGRDMWTFSSTTSPSDVEEYCIEQSKQRLLSTLFQLKEEIQGEPQKALELVDTRLRG